MNISKDRGKELTGFQRAPFHPSIDLATDFVMPYGVGEDVCERIENGAKGLYCSPYDRSRLGQLSGLSIR